MASEPPEPKKSPSTGIANRLKSLEEQQSRLSKEMEDLQKFQERVVRTLWLVELLEAVAATIGSPLRKGIEMVITAIIIYIVTHTHIAP